MVENIFDEFDAETPPVESRCDIKPAVRAVACALPARTFRGHECLVVGGAPADWVQLGRHDVAPEVGLAVVAVAAVAQQQQLATGSDDGGHPVGVAAAAAAALVSHLQLHARLEAALQAGFHLLGARMQWHVKHS